MAKIAAAAAAAAAALCLAALVAVAVGQGEVERQRLKDLQCWQEVQESPLDACRQVLDRQLTGGMRYGVGPFRWGTGLRMRCCQQLKDVSRECRCAAIRSMVRGYEETMPPLEKGWGGSSRSRATTPAARQERDTVTVRVASSRCIHRVVPAPGEKSPA
ncbi:unnamed protein product [Miscanthus lutarioriparius]|uniref:Bifunctional inhibitor/plant lipid transfer protein/seed storage helical domain-containing protein n=1 Tax=Miscanthus lutarioriparius TaxID=422564 RepID=A0A811RMH5_9POAL|nr:unnamed protein product [Miscanthus lutarioriparius]